MSKWDTVLTMTSVRMKLWRHTAHTYVFPIHLVKNGLIHLPQNLTDLNNFTCTHVEREVNSMEDVEMVLDHLCIHCATCPSTNIVLLHYAEVRSNYAHILSSHRNLQNQHGIPSFRTLHYVLLHSTASLEIMCGTVHNVQWRGWRKIWGTISTAFKFTMDSGSPLLHSPASLHYRENSRDLYSCFRHHISSISVLYWHTYCN